jgi:hypothetical protein
LIQGTAADVLKNATVRLDWFLTERWGHPWLGLLNTIHDEMMIEVPYEMHSIQLMREICWVMQMDSARCGIPVPLPVGMKVTKPLYSMREGRIVQRWSDTMDIAIRPQHVLDHWKQQGKVPDTKDGEEKFLSMLGGVPYLPEEEEEFRDLEAFMRDCPFEPLLDVHEDEPAIA